MKTFFKHKIYILMLFLTGGLSLALTFLNPDNMYIAMENNTRYYTEDFSVRIDLDGDGTEELIENQAFSDGGHVCSVYKKIEDTIYVGYVSDLLNEPYDKVGIDIMKSYYDRENNAVFFIYKHNGLYKNALRNLNASKMEFVPLDPMLYDNVNYDDSRV